MATAEMDKYAHDIIKNTPYSEMVLPTGRFARIVKELRGDDLRYVNENYSLNSAWIGFILRAVFLEQSDGQFSPITYKEVMNLPIHDAVALNLAINKLLPQPK